MAEFTPPDTHSAPSSGCPVSALAASFDPFCEDYLQDPYRYFARFRAQEPVFYSPQIGYWVVSRYEDIIRIYKDAETFSSAETVVMITPPCEQALHELMQGGYAPSTQLVDEDPPQHSQHRRVIRKGLTLVKVAELEPYTRRFVTQSLDALVQNGRADLVEELVFSVPALTAFILMGVPEAEVDRVRGYAKRLALWIWGRPTADEQVDLARDFVAYLGYAREHVRRLMTEPGDDYISNMVRAWQADPDEALWDENYLVTVMQGHLFAAHETTTDAAAAGFKVLLENRSQWEAICADPDLIPNAVEEVLRFQTSVPVCRRLTTCPTTLGGHALPAGSRIMILNGSANHDSEKFPDGESFDITRANARQHVAFGWGAHLCLGRELARMELRVILEEASRRLPHMQLVQPQDWIYSHNTSHRGPQHVRVVWDPARNPQPTDRAQ
jgi:cytochrome P450